MNPESVAKAPYNWDVFISSASVDKMPVERLIGKLKADGFRVWYELEQIGAGGRTLGQLVDGIAASKHLIACLSDAYLRREWTIFELQTNQTLDPANLRNRTIPAQIEPLTLDLPPEISSIVCADLSDPHPGRYEEGYQKLVRLIKPTPSAPPPISNLNDLETKYRTLAKYADEPNVALFQLRVTATALCRFLHQQLLGPVAGDGKLDFLVQKILDRGNLPPPIKVSLGIVQTYGNLAVTEQQDDYVISREFVQPGLAALEALWNWTRQLYRPARDTTSAKDLWDAILEQLPYRLGKREIPDSDYTLKPQRISFNSLGPLYPGERNPWGQAVAINLVALAEEQDAAFFGEIARFIRLSHANIVRPLHVDRLTVDGKRLCLYVVLEPIDGASAQDLVDRFGPLPELVATELALGASVALEGLHKAQPSIIHGDIKPANIVADTLGQVKALCVGRNVGIMAEQTLAGAVDGKIDSFLFSSPERLSGSGHLTTKTDLFALRAMLFYLLTGEYEARLGTGSETAQISPTAQETLKKLSVSETASRARSILEAACRKLGNQPYNLRLVVDAYLKGLEQLPHVPPDVKDKPPPSSWIITDPIRKPPGSSSIALLTDFSIEGSGAWPLGEGRILVWEHGSRTLVILDEQGEVWRDKQTLPLRRVVQGPDDHWAALGWDGCVRSFARGTCSTALKLNGTIGDARFGSKRWIIGTWKHTLVSIPVDSGRAIPLPPEIDKGILRIATMENGEWFAVADLSGGIALYSSWARRCVVPSQQRVSSLAFAGKQLLVLQGSTLSSIDLLGRTSSRDRQEGAVCVLPGFSPDHCLLVTQRGEIWALDERGRRELYGTFPLGYTFSSACHAPKRLILKRPDTGFAYWREGKLEQEWSDALAATLSVEGKRIAVTLPGKVLLYEVVE